MNHSILVKKQIEGGSVCKKYQDPPQLGMSFWDITEEQLNAHRQFVGSEGAEGERLMKRGGNYVEKDLSGMNLEQGHFQGADFTGANLEGVSFAGGDFSGARFINANLKGASFEGADVGGVFFDGADLTEANLASADCSGTSFINANLSNANCHNTDLIAANLTGAQQAGLRLEGAITTDARGIEI